MTQTPNKSYPHLEFPTLWTVPAFQLFTIFDSLAGLAAVAVIIAFLYKKYQAAPKCKNGLPLPPGPPAQPFWQNALPSVNIAHTLANWVAEYGPVITLRQGSQVIVVIGRVDVRFTLRAATEIMEKEGSALADRPRLIAAGELLSRGLRLLLISRGERFRRYRKVVHTHLQPKAVRAYRAMQRQHAKNVVTDILNDHKNHRVHAQRYAASVILGITYGKSTPTSNDDPEVVRTHQSTQNFQLALRPGAFLVDRIPWLKYIPGYGSQLKRFHEFELRLYRDQMNRVESEMEANKASNSFMKTLLEHTSEHQLSRDEMAYLAGNLFDAGSETTAVAITNMILAAAAHPEAQRRVQDQLDAVVGRDRLPTWEDVESLPQVYAFVSEALRWRPVISIGFAHRASEDIVWRGQWIPAGATVLGCHWAISQDPVAYPNPEKFDPQRWIDDQGRFRNDMNGSFPYGFGRRICPGLYLANESLYMNLALLLWSFHIAERPDAPIDVNAFEDAVVSRAAPFDVGFIPRIAEDRLRMMCESAI